MSIIRQSKRRQQTKRSGKREKATFSQLAQASNQVAALFEQWLEAAPPTGRSKRIEDQVEQGVSRLIAEIHSGKTADVEKRFQRLIERVEADHLPKKQATLHQTLDAMQRLLETSRQWHQAALRSKSEQEYALHTLRLLLREIEAGHVEHIEKRFRQAMMQNKSRNDQNTLDQSAKIFCDVMAEARIVHENITDPHQQNTIYAKVTDIVQDTIETIQSKPLPDTPTAPQLREEIEQRNRRLLSGAQDESNL